MALASTLNNRMLTDTTGEAAEELYYPESDGKPMAETDDHRIAATEVIAMLSDRYDGTDTYVAGNNMLYYVQGNPRRSLSPDAYVVFGIGSQPRRVYKVWENGGKAPAVVFEFTSRSTQSEDVETKHRLYEQVLGVPEYFLFDPTGEYLLPRLRGLRLNTEGVYEPIAMTEERLFSEPLGLEVYAEGLLLRLHDPLTGVTYRTRAEKNAAIEREAQRAEQAEAESETAARLRRDAEGRAETAEGRADAEAQRRREAEAEIQRLRALLAAALNPSDE